MARTGSTGVRRRICQNLSFFGIELDEHKNNLRSSEIREINANDGKVKILIIPTNEELEIARQCFNLLGGS